MFTINNNSKTDDNLLQHLSCSEAI